MSYPTILPQSARVLEEVSEERARQDDKWGQQNHPTGTGDDRHLLRDPNLPTWGTICYRARNLTDAAADGGNLEYIDILLEEVAEAFSESDPALPTRGTDPGRSCRRRLGRSDRPARVGRWTAMTTSQMVTWLQRVVGGAV